MCDAMLAFLLGPSLCILPRTMCRSVSALWPIPADLRVRLLSVVMLIVQGSIARLPGVSNSRFLAASVSSFSSSASSQMQRDSHPVTTLASPALKTKPSVVPSPMAIEFLAPHKMAAFAVNYILSFRFYFMFMARTTFQVSSKLTASHGIDRS